MVRSKNISSQKTIVLVNFTRYEPDIIRQIYDIRTENNLVGQGSSFHPSKLLFAKNRIPTVEKGDIEGY